MYAVVDGEVELRAFEELLEEAVGCAAAQGLTRILVDGRNLSGVLTNSERYKLAIDEAEHFALKEQRPSIAFVGHPPEFNGLAAMAAREIGVDVRLFTDTSQALAWLSEPEAMKAASASA